MDKKDYRLKGHESFILRDGWITKGLRAVNDNPKVFTEYSGADALGVGTNMAKAIRYWLRTAGLTRECQKGVFLTEFGKLVYKNDLYIEDIFTLWIIHINIARNFALATSWNVFFNNLSVMSFKRDELNVMMTELLTNIIGDTPPDRSVKDDCSAILQMYSSSEESTDPEDKKNSPFAVLGLISSAGKNQFEKVRPTIDAVDPMVIMFMIADVLQQEKVIHIDDIVGNDNMPGKLLNLNRVVINDFLDLLNNAGYLIVNRTAGLDVVYPNKNVTPINVIQNHYEGSR